METSVEETGSFFAEAVGAVAVIGLFAYALFGGGIAHAAALFSAWLYG